MKTKPKISIIMSVFNGMTYLVEAIESILVQTYKNFELIEKNPQIDICCSFVSVIDKDGKIIDQIKKPLTDSKIKKELFWLTPLLHPTWFVKKEVFRKLKGYDEKWDYVEDFEFLIRAKDFKMANIPRNLVLFRSQAERRSHASIEKIY